MMKLKVHWEKEHSHVAQAHVDYDDLLEDYIIKAGLPLPGTSPQVVAAKTEPHGEDEPISRSSGRRRQRRLRRR